MWNPVRSLLNAATSRLPGSSHPWWFKLVAANTKANVRVTPEKALTYSAVWAATSLYTETISSLPRKFMEVDGDKRKSASDHPAYQIFLFEPNPEAGADGWVSSLIHHYINWGNAFALKNYDPRTGRVNRVWPIHPSRIPEDNLIRATGEEEITSPNDANMIVGLARPGTLIYKVETDHDEIGEARYYHHRDVMHIVGRFPDDSLYGKGVITSSARESIAAAIGANEYGATFLSLIHI